MNSTSKKNPLPSKWRVVEGGQLLPERRKKERFKNASDERPKLAQSQPPEEKTKGEANDSLWLRRIAKSLSAIGCPSEFINQKFDELIVLKAKNGVIVAEFHNPVAEENKPCRHIN